MTSVSAIKKTYNYLPFTVAMITGLILLINVSFKIIMVQGVLFSASSVLCPFVAALYLFVLNRCNPTRQRQVLNQSLLALYVFSIGIYLLVNLPAVENTRINDAYQIIFEDIPRKFFSATIAFGLSFYLPYICFFRKQVSQTLFSPRLYLLLTTMGGSFFFSIDFWLLFSDPQPENFLQIYINSLIISTAILIIMAVTYLFFLSKKNTSRDDVNKQVPACYLNSTYHYLVVFSVIILLICLSCEYRLISFPNGFILVASGILFPLNIIVSNIVSELYGYKANLRKTLMILFSDLIFDLGILITVVLPSPDFFDLNPFYSCLVPRRISATVLALFLALGCNAWLLEKLKNTVYDCHRALRIFVANLIANSLLCVVNYSILFVGVYPYEQIFNLAWSSWSYKFVVTLVSLPLVLWLFEVFRSHAVAEDEFVLQTSFRT